MKNLAKTVIEKYGTNDPYEIAKSKGILIVAEPLGTIHGYYDSKFPNLIHVNEYVPMDIRKYILACLLYHAVLKPEETIVLKERDQISEHEKQLHAFAFHLLND